MEISQSVECWWRGLQLWYNDQDYMHAIVTWEEAMGFISWANEELFVDTSLKNSAIQERTYLTLHGDTASLSELSPLLLFLAGCYLDAQEYRKARVTLRRCLALASIDAERDSTSNKNDLFHRTIRECIFYVEEDPECLKSWREARELIQYAIKVDQQSEKERLSEIGEANSVPWSDPWQRPGFLYPIINQESVYDRLSHPSWCRLLEERWGDIRNEFHRLIHRPGGARTLSASPRHWPAVGSGVHRGGAGAHDGSVVAPGGDWREVVIFGSGENPQLAPFTSELLEQACPDAVSLARQGGGEIVFSVLAPGTHIRPHCGSTNLRLTAHLGLVIPEDNLGHKRCSIRVADQWLDWEEGKIIVFDDSFEHEVINERSTLRGVLLLRFWHPNLPKEERGIALQKALDAKSDDELQRYSPPSPSNDRPMMLRAMEKSRCTLCSRHGYSSIRLDTRSLTFQCQCGQSITS
ncbi:aspartate beta-hydroxylase [Fistulifera solaris]|uniref:Aspartate beta-hydroxylase n=1 Tax=Fistulifera solaris TaxID=1519565 RepID=A0A1Z5J6Q8_FISSO|nr:aspartate beta-hydroxylase [Fistulifera solaris]|eukprot:GAX09461.1 aspartate beta-hydroxylase [Fistulifera solaris]